MKKGLLLITGLLLTALCAAVILVRGTAYTLEIPTGGAVNSLDDVSIRIEGDAQSIDLTEQRLENGKLYLGFRSVCRGNVWVDVYRNGGDPLRMTRLIVHGNGVITRDTYFGDCTGSRMIPVSVILFLLLLLWNLIREYRRSVRENLYQYRNVKYLGVIIYFCGMLLGQTWYLFTGNGLSGAAETAMSAASLLALLAFPVAFVVSILVTISNIRLMRREGRTWRNMLGCALGLLLCLATIFPDCLSYYLHWSQAAIDVHRENGLWRHVFMAVENGILVMLTYLECILLGTIVLGFKAARRIPAFDKDYILILGCQINADGTLTNLLKGRADRALEFARLQKEAVGREITFVPSGGQGGDEIVSEGAAIRRYLLENGVAPEKILTEDRSANTYENFRNSLALIRENTGQTEPRIAFSTTNYHVFRSGIIATEQGIRAEGIGSKTKSYFWVNAFVREFVATMASEWRTHVSLTAAMMLAMLALVAVVYVSNAL